MQVRFQNKQEQPFQQYRSYSKSHLNTISCLLQQLQTRTNSNIIKQLWSNVQGIESITTHEIQKLSKIVKKGNSFYLSIKQIEQLLKQLATSFCQVLQEFPNRRIESLYSQLLHISFRLRTLQPTSIHTHSTRMKQHLLDELKDQKKKRNQMQKQYVIITQEYHKLAEISANKQNQRESVIQQYHKMQCKVQQLSQQLGLLRQTNNKLKGMNQSLKKQKSDIRNQLNQLINTPCSQCMNKKMKIQESEQEIKRLNQQLNILNQQKNKIEQNGQFMKQEMDRLNKQVEELHKIRLNRQNTIVQLEQQLNDTTRKLKQFMQNDTALRNKNDQLDKQVDNLNIQLRDHQRQIHEMSEEIHQSKKLENQLHLQRESFIFKSEELEVRIEELETHINEMSEMQDHSEEVIRKLNRQLEERQKNTNIHRDTAEKLRKQINQLKRKKDEIIEQKSDQQQQQDGIMRIISREKQPSRSGIHNATDKRRFPYGGNKNDSLLQDSRKRSNPEIQIVEDQLLRMLLTQALSLQSFLEKD